MVLGELEKQVLQYLWSVPDADAKQVHSVLTKKRSGTLNTIQSTLDRLYKKKLLNRKKQGHAYYYFSKVNRDELLAKLIHDVANDFLNKGENSLIAAFSSVSDKLDEEQLDELEQLINDQRKRQKKQ